MTTTRTVSPIDMLDSMLTDGVDIYEAAVQIGMTAEVEIDERRWLTGDVCLRVEKAYGAKIIEKFSAALNVNTSTLKQRRLLASFYPTETRALFPSLGYSHYRTCVRLASLESALGALEMAANEHLTVWVLAERIDKILGKQRPAPPTEGKVTRRWSQEDGFFVVVKFDNEVDFHMGQLVTVKGKLATD